jgi:predicted TIM-barrel fold metal-dependent hydrolase
LTDREAVVMTGHEIVDSHFHLWDRATTDLTWSWLVPGTTHPNLGDISPLQTRDYTVDDYIADAAPTGVAKAVHVQAAIGTDDPVRETAWLQGCADRTGFPHGIVGHADLKDPGVEGVLERHGEFANVRGIRDFSYGDYLVEDAWHRGFGLLEKYDLVCDLDCTWENMPKARDVARRFPGVTVVLDHAGFPQGRDADYFRAWRDGMAAIAQADNVVCKVSGLGMGDHMAGRQWTAETIRPYVEGCLETFGIERCFFGSNWPVDSLFGDYATMLAAYQTLTADLSESERTAFFVTNATRTYRL